MPAPDNVDVNDVDGALPLLEDCKREVVQDVDVDVTDVDHVADNKVDDMEDENAADVVDLNLVSPDAAAGPSGWRRPGDVVV
jgi:hypothetical protein